MDADTFRQRMVRLPKYIDLDSLIKLSNALAIDPYITDWQHRGCNRQLAETVYEYLNIIRERLYNAGFSEYKQGVIAAPNVLKYLENYLHFKTIKLKPIRSNRAGNNLYILTKEAGGRLFIHPPWDDHNNIISWDEYFLRTTRGEKLHLMIIAPWAQAKIMDIE